MSERDYDSPEGIDRTLAEMERFSAYFCKEMADSPNGPKYIETHLRQDAKISYIYLQRKAELIARGRTEDTCNLTHDLKDSLRADGLAIIHRRGLTEEDLRDIWKLPRSMIHCYLKGDLASFDLEMLVVCLAQLGVRSIEIRCQ